MGEVDIKLLANSVRSLQRKNVQVESDNFFDTTWKTVLNGNGNTSDLSQLNNGIYFVKILIGNERTALKKVAKN